MATLNLADFLLLSQRVTAFAGSVDRTIVLVVLAITPFLVFTGVFVLVHLQRIARLLDEINHEVAGLHKTERLRHD